MHTLHTRAATIYNSWAQEEGEDEERWQQLQQRGSNEGLALDGSGVVVGTLWVICWCPILQGRHCSCLSCLAHQYVCLCVCLSVCLSGLSDLSVCFVWSICMICLVHLYGLHGPSVWSVCLSICVSFCLSICLVCLSGLSGPSVCSVCVVHLSVRLSACLSVRYMCI